MKLSAVSKIFALFLGMLALPAQAAFIVNNTDQVEAFSLSETFESFYGYGEVAQGSSNTGFEQDNTTVMLIAENAGEYALIVTFDDTVAPDTWDQVRVTLTDLSDTLGSFLLVDDPTDEGAFVGATYTTVHGFANGKNDGFIYSLGDGNGLDLTLLTEVLRGTLDNSVFLSNDAGGVNQIVLGANTTLTSAAAVSTPGLAALIAMGFALVCFRKARKS